MDHVKGDATSRGLSREAQKALPVMPATAAWWYEDATSVGVYIAQVNGPTFNCHISLRALESYVKRARAIRRRKK